MSERVPEGWSASKLREICSSIRGVSYKPENLQSSKSEKTATLLRSNNIQAYGLNLNEVQYVDIDKVKPRQIALEGDIAVCMANGSRRLVGKNAIFRGLYSSETFTVGAFCSIIRANKNSTHQFIRHLLKSNAFTQQVGLSLAGSAINNLKDGDVEDYTFSLPPLPEQKKIASILTSVDEVIEKTQSQIDKLQNLKKATMNELLTRGIGHTEFKDSELGRIPKSWEVTKLRDIGKFSKGKGISKAETLFEGIPCIRYAEIYTHYDFVIRSFVSYISKETSKGSRKLNRGDIAFAGSGETVDDIGKSVAFVSDFEAFVGGDTIVFSPTIEIDSIFLSYQLNDDIRRILLRKYGQGSSVIHIYSSALEDLKISILPIPEQKIIASILEAINKNIEAKQRKLHQTQSLKKSLMQDLLTGKVRVSVN